MVRDLKLPNHVALTLRQRRIIDEALKVEGCKALLPKVGDRFLRIPTHDSGVGINLPDPQPCTVVQVHEEHRWYMVVFDKSGVRECVKVPEPTYNTQRKGAVPL